MSASSSDEPDFRPIQYLGSKWRILDQVNRAVESVSSGRRPLAVDLFAGSGVVARRLAHTQPVLAADIQEYSRVLTSALLHPNLIDVRTLLSDTIGETEHREPWLRDLLVWELARVTSAERLVHLAADLEVGSLQLKKWHTALPNEPILDAAHSGSAGSTDWTLLSHYGGVFFSYRQAADLDAIARVVRRIPPDQRDTPLAALLSTASEVVSSVGGHFAQPIKPRNTSGQLKLTQLENLHRVRMKDVRKIFDDKLRRFSRLSRPVFEGHAVRSSFEDVVDNLPSDAGVVYADPPYTREHYSRFYHVLETIAMGDQPGISTVRLGGEVGESQGLYRVNRHQSPFSIVSQAPAAFDYLCARLAHREISLVLSYSPVPENEKPRARVIGMEPLLRIVGSHFKHLQVIEATGMRHSKFNHSSKNAPAVDEAEVLILARTS